MEMRHYCHKSLLYFAPLSTSFPDPNLNHKAFPLGQSSPTWCLATPHRSLIEIAPEQLAGTFENYYCELSTIRRHRCRVQFYRTSEKIKKLFKRFVLIGNVNVRDKERDYVVRLTRDLAINLIFIASRAEIYFFHF